METNYQAFYKKNSEWRRYLRPFGEIGIVTDHKKRKIRAKLQDRGIPCMFLGYSDNHSGNVNRFLNLKTLKIIHSRDVIWLGKTYGEWKGLSKVNITQVKKDLDDSNSDNEKSSDKEEKKEDKQPARNIVNVGS